jgi:hypothetical protein
MSKPRTVTDWVWLTVTTPDAWNEDARVPADAEEWNESDRRIVIRMERLAQRVGTHVQRTSYRLL